MKNVLTFGFTVVLFVGVVFVSGCIANRNTDVVARTEYSDQYRQKISCAYSGIEVDVGDTKWDPTNKIFYCLVSNTGAEPIILNKVQIWIDHYKQPDIKLNIDCSTLTTIDKNDCCEVYINLSAVFAGGGITLSKIKFNTECDAVFDSVTLPQMGWNEFTWSGEPLANQDGCTMSSNQNRQARTTCSGRCDTSGYQSIYCNREEEARRATDRSMAYCKSYPYGVYRTTVCGVPVEINC